MWRLLCWMLVLTVASGAEPWSRQYRGFVSCLSSGWEVLRTPEEYRGFVARVPRHRLQKKLPAPPSNDPLLLLPEVDFTQSCLVAVWSDNVHVDARVVQAEIEGQNLWLEVRFLRPRNVEGYAAPHGFGQYHLVELPRFEGSLQVKEREVVDEP